jgi:Tfp pilus assembly protein PilF
MILKELAKQRPVVMLGLAAVTMTAYWRIRDLAFINYDDTLYVTSNAQVQTGLSWTSVRWAFTTVEAANWHPITWLSHLLDYQLYGLEPEGHHLISLMIHVANVLVLFWVLQWITRALWPSAFVAALFALHPLNVESVAWVAERKNLLSTLFWILTIAAYAWYARAPGWKRYLLVMLSFALGLMSKPMVITMPFALLLLDYWPLGRLAARPSGKENSDDIPLKAKRKPPLVVPDRYSTRSATGLLLEKVPLFLLVVASGIITVMAQQNSGTVGSTEQFPVGVRMENALVSYAVYLQKTIWPSGLAVFYPHPKALLPLWQPALAAFVLLAITGLAIWGARHHRYLPVGWLWYLGTLVPVIGLVQVGAQSRADRYAYLPLIGVFIVIAWGTAELAKRLRVAPYWLPAVAICVLLVFGILTRHNLSYWHDSVSLFTHAQNVTRDNYIADNNLGEALAQQGNVDRAFAEFSKAIAANPAYDQAHQNMGMALVQQRKLDQAVVEFRKTVELNPKSYDAYNKLGAALLNLGQLDEAMVCFSKALEISPDFAPALVNMGTVLEKQGKTDQALESYTHAVQFLGNTAMAAQAYTRMGNLYVKKGEPEPATDCYRKALTLKPDYAPARQGLNTISPAPGRNN